MKYCNLKFALPALIAGLALGILGAVTTSSNAQTANANLIVSATVPAACTIAGTNMAFGNYTGAIALQSQALIDVTCQSESTFWMLGADAGTNAVGCVRRMTDGQNNFLTYDLYLDLGTLAVFGSVGGPCDTGTNVVGQGSNQDPTIFGLVGDNQIVPTGSYSDTVVMTVFF